VVDLLQQGVSAQIAPAVTNGTSGAVRTSGLVKIVTLTPHGINPALGGTVIIAGLLPADLDGTYEVIPGSVIDAYTFSYAQNGNPRMKSRRTRRAVRGRCNMARRTIRLIRQTQ